MENLEEFQPVNEVGEEEPKKPVVKKFPKEGVKGMLLPLIFGLLIILAGVGSGWLLSGGGKNKGVSEVVPGAEQSQSEAGLSDEATFRDNAEGILEEGGVNGEGTHHLVRDGGPTQYVYLTSTVIDLQSFSGKKVQVWGETISAQKAGWLMDVGRIKVLD